MDLETRFRKAIENGEMLTIIYHGGSHAGIARRVLPVRVTDDALWAIEADGEIRKQFKLAKLELAPEGATAQNLSDTPPEEPQTLNEAMAPHMPVLEASGWTIVCDDRRIALYGRFKNGNLRKAPALEINYCEPVPTVSRSVTVRVEGRSASMEEVEESTTANARPWGVSCKGSGWNYKLLSRAVARFMEQFAVLGDP